MSHDDKDRKPMIGAEPSYRSFRKLPLEQRWQWYENAKRIRRGREMAGVKMAETYDQFIARVTRELGI